MAPPELEVLASTIVDRLPSVLERLRKYEQQNGLLEIQCGNLEREIGFVRSGMTAEGEKQEKIKERIAELNAKGVAGKKRPRDNDENAAVNAVNVRPRRKRRELPSEDSRSSVVSTRTKRRGRVFSDEEAEMVLRD